MDKQHFDHIENRIREAAESISTPVNEEAWQKMEVLLDKESDKDRKRAIIWWWYAGLFCFFIGSGLWFYFHRQHDVIRQHGRIMDHGNGDSGSNLKQSDVFAGHAIIKKKVDARKPVEHLDSKSLLQEFATTNTKDDDNASNNKKYLSSKSAKGINPDASSSAVQYGRLKKSLKKKGDSGRDSYRTRKTRKLITAGNEVSNPVKGDSASQEAGSFERQVTGEKIDSVLPFKSDTALARTTDPLKKDSSAENQIAKKPAQINLSQNKRGLYITGSVAPDATAVGKIDLKNIKPVFGLGIGYRFNKRVSVQTGFYAGRKLYTAGPGDYKIKQGSNISQILLINADCYIYELPLWVRFDVVTKKRYNIYGGVGLSTYIFKKENYDFHFLNLTGAYRRMPYNYKNNTDIFSVVDLSIGFEHKLFNNFYIQGEPYLKLPVSGLGEGKLKLNSAGFLLGVKYQLLKKKNNK